MNENFLLGTRQVLSVIVKVAEILVPSLLHMIPAKQDPLTHVGSFSVRIVLGADGNLT